MKIFKLILPVIFIFFSCSNDSDNIINNENAQLELTINDAFIYPLENIEVNLYASQNDFDNNTNVVASLTTDIYGKVLFENLQPITYYWRTNSNCYTNNDTHSSEQPLTGNATNQFLIHLTDTGVGDIIVYNNNSEGYNVSYVGYENGSFSINANSTISLNDFHSGDYTFTLTGLESGEIIEHVIIVNCGETSEVYFE